MARKAEPLPPLPTEGGSYVLQGGRWIPAAEATAATPTPEAYHAADLQPPDLGES